MRKIRETATGKEWDDSPGLAAALMDQGIDFEYIEAPDPPAEVVLSDKHDRQIAFSTPGTKSFDELIAKGWYVIEGLSPDDVPEDYEPQL